MLSFQVVYLHDESSTIWVGHTHILNCYCMAEIKLYNNKNIQSKFKVMYIFIQDTHILATSAIVAVIILTLLAHISSEKSIRALEVFRWAGFTKLLFCCSSLTSLTLSMSWLMLPQPVMITHLKGFE